MKYSITVSTKPEMIVPIIESSGFTVVNLLSPPEASGINDGPKTVLGPRIHNAVVLSQLENGGKAE
jgi:hypothetical protein